MDDDPSQTMRAAWYDRQGPAAEVLRVGRRPVARPGPGEVRVRLRSSGISPGDVKKRQGWQGSTMVGPVVVPHSDGAGVIDAVGPGVAPARVGTRVWTFNAQSYRAFGTAAEATVVPSDLAVDLPDEVDDLMAACLGIPGITAHRAVFGDGPVSGQTVLVHGVLGAVGSLAAQLARWGGASVISTVRTGADRERVTGPAGDAVVALDADDAVQTVRGLAPNGVHRVVEVALAANATLDAAVLADGATIAAYASPGERVDLPFWPLLFKNTTLRLLGSDDFPAAAKQQAAADLTRAAASGELVVRRAPAYRLDEVVAAHEAVEAGQPQGRVVLDLRA